MKIDERFFKTCLNKGQPERLISEVKEQWYKSKKTFTFDFDKLDTLSQLEGIRFFMMGYSSAKIKDSDDRIKQLKKDIQKARKVKK